MKRVIKFRSFCPKTKVMNYKPFEIVRYADLNLNELIEKISKDKILMQFTGKKDIKLNEIYDGDIMQYQFVDEPNEPFYVCWNEGSWCTKYKHWDKYTFSKLDVFTIENSLVIGNMHENPERLNK